MTREGFQKMEAELFKLRNEDLKECLQNISDASESGNIGENVEYMIAKNSLDELNNRINKLSNILNNADVITGTIDNGTVQLLTWVKFLNRKNNAVTEYRIVPEHDINLKEGKISQNSPIGSALFGKKVGDVVKVTVPAGILELEIQNIRIS